MYHSPSSALRILVVNFITCYKLCRIKLIWSGKVLKMNTELATHGVQNGTQIMAVVLHSNPEELKVRSLIFYQ
jgi:hypothetical protein